MSTLTLIDETFAYGLVIGCSVFGIIWGIVNTLLVSYNSDTLLLICFAIFLSFFRCRSSKLIWKITPTSRKENKSKMKVKSNTSLMVKVKEKLAMKKLANN